MRLTQLEIENFKCIGERQTIDFKPITLLFGPNSAGKSTVFHALLYLRDILNGNISKLETPNTHGGESRSSGFESLVHQQDIQKIIRIKARVKLNENFHDEIFPVNTYGIDRKISMGFELENLQLNYIMGEKLFNGYVECVGVAIEIAWDGDEPIINRIDIEHNNMLTLSITPKKYEGYRSNETLSGVKLPKTPFLSPGHEIKINFEHKILKQLDESFQQEMIDLRSNNAEKVIDFNENTKNRIKRQKKILLHNRMIDEKIKNYFTSPENVSPLAIEMQELILGKDSKAPIFDLYNFDISKICNRIDYLFAMNDTRFILSTHKCFKFTNIPEDQLPEGRKAWESRCSRFNAILVELFSGPLQAINQATESLLHIDALRQIPTSHADFLTDKNTKDYWKLFNRLNGHSLASYVNDWLNKEPFWIRYNIELIDSKVISSSSEFSKLLEREKFTKSDFLKLKKLFKNSPSGDRIVKLRDTESDVILDFADVGIGVSQLIPVLVAACYEDFGLVTIEQPELHVHPAIQIAMGELFYFAGLELRELDRIFLIEAHSEHLLLRILRRIQQSNNNILPSGYPKITPKDVSVIYVKHNKRRSEYKQLRIDETGEFIDQWPNGFFEEREEELF